MGATKLDGTGSSNLSGDGGGGGSFDPNTPLVLSSTLLVEGANNASKMKVNRNGGTMLFNVDTTTPRVDVNTNNFYVNGVLYSGGGFNPSVPITLTDTLLINGSASNKKFQIDDPLNEMIFKVDSNIDEVSVGGFMTLYDSTGRSPKFQILEPNYSALLLADTTQHVIKISGIDSLSKLYVADSLNNGIFRVNTTDKLVSVLGPNSANKFFVENNSIVKIFNVNTTTDTVTTKNNTLDNGSGLMQCSRLVMNSVNDLQTLNIRDALNSMVFNVDTTNGIVQGKNNILNGINGEMTISGQLAVSGTNDAEKFVVRNASNSAALTVNTTNQNTTFGGAVAANGNLSLTGTTPKLLTSTNQALNIEVDNTDGTNAVLILRNIAPSGTYGSALYMYHGSGKGIRFNVDTTGNCIFFAGENAGTGSGFNPGNNYDLGSLTNRWNNNHFNNLTLYNSLTLNTTATLTTGSGAVNLGTGTVTKTSGNWTMGTGTITAAGTMTMSGAAGITMTSGTLTLGTGTVTKTSGNWTMGSGTVIGTGNAQFPLLTTTAANNALVSPRLVLTNSGTGAGTGVQITMNGHNGTAAQTATHTFNGTNMFFTPPTGGFFGPGVDNAFAFGGAANRVTQLFSVSATINTSDEREKNSILTSDLGLEFINLLRPVSYKWNVKQRDPVYDENGEIVSYIEHPGVRKHYGLIAQEVKDVLDVNNIPDFAGFIHDQENDKFGLRYSEFISPMIKAIQDLSSLVTSQAAQIATLQNQVNSLLNG